MKIAMCILFLIVFLPITIILWLLGSLFTLLGTIIYFINDFIVEHTLDRM